MGCEKVITVDRPMVTVKSVTAKKERGLVNDFIDNSQKEYFIRFTLSFH